MENRSTSKLYCRKTHKLTTNLHSGNFLFTTTYGSKTSASLTTCTAQILYPHLTLRTARQIRRVYS